MTGRLLPVSIPEPSCPWIGHLPRGLPLLWGILDTPLHHSCGIWVGSFSQDIQESGMAATILQQIGYYCCVVFLKGGGLPHHLVLKPLTGHPHCLQFWDVDVCSYLFLLATYLWTIGYSDDLHNPSWKHLLLWLPPALRVCVLVLVVAWKSATKGVLGLLLVWASSPSIDWLCSCKFPLARVAGDGGSALSVVDLCWKICKPSSFSIPLHVWKEATMAAWVLITTTLSLGSDKVMSCVLKLRPRC